MSPWLVFVLTWAANVASAAGVYALARRHGAALSRGVLGRHILTPNTVAQIARQYEKHGTYGIFLSRLLPIWRGVVMPFAGIARLHPARALIPMALASALYYGALTWVVMRLGTDFETVVARVTHVNKALAIVAGVFVLIIVVWIIRRRLQRPPSPPS